MKKEQARFVTVTEYAKMHGKQVSTIYERVKKAGMRLQKINLNGRYKQSVIDLHNPPPVVPRGRKAA